MSLARGGIGSGQAFLRGIRDANHLARPPQWPTAAPPPSPLLVRQTPLPKSSELLFSLPLLVISTQWVSSSSSSFCFSFLSCVVSTVGALVLADATRTHPQPHTPLSTRHLPVESVGPTSTRKKKKTSTRTFPFKVKVKDSLFVTHYVLTVPTRHS